MFPTVTSVNSKIQVLLWLVLAMYVDCGKNFDKLSKPDTCFIYPHATDSQEEVYEFTIQSVSFVTIHQFLIDTYGIFFP